MKRQYLTLEARHSQKHRDHHEVAERLLESPEGGHEKNSLMMQAEIISRECMRTAVLMEMQREIKKERENRMKLRF